MKKNHLNCALKFLFVLILPFVVLNFSACEFHFDPSNLVPEIFISTDAKLSYDESQAVYNVTLKAGEEYEIKADLGDYGENEFYIVFELENDSDIVSLQKNKIIVSPEILEEKEVTVLVKLKKTNEEKTYSTVKIKVLVEKEI